MNDNTNKSKKLKNWNTILYNIRIFWIKNFLMLFQSQNYIRVTLFIEKLKLLKHFDIFEQSIFFNDVSF